MNLLMKRNLLCLSIFFMLSLPACQAEDLEKPTSTENEQIEQSEDLDQIEDIEQTDQVDVRSTETLEEHETTTNLHIMAVGDIMMHMPQVDAARKSDGDGYDFNPVFADAAPLFAQADLVLGNLETTLGGSERGFSGYPQFNSPDELARSLYESNFDIITTANNHSLDTYESGLLRTLDVLESAGLNTSGTFRSQEDRDAGLHLTENDIDIAVLSYTYGTNGIPIPEGKDYLVNLLDPTLMKSDIEQAHINSDLVIVALHFGQEYQTMPNQQQKDLVDLVFEWGADIILGSHPHVLQPYQFREWHDDQGELRQGVVIYSLGNFVSNQRDEPREIGGILSIQIEKTGSNIQITDADLIITYVHRYSHNSQRMYRILPMESIMNNQDIAALSATEIGNLEQRYLDMLDHVTSLDGESAP